MVKNHSNLKINTYDSRSIVFELCFIDFNKRSFIPNFSMKGIDCSGDIIHPTNERYIFVVTNQKKSLLFYILVLSCIFLRIINK